MKTKEELDALVEKWKAEPPERGKPTCPCGFRGGGRNITAHRRGCEVWYHAFGMKMPALPAGIATAALLLLSTLAANADQITLKWDTGTNACPSFLHVSHQPLTLANLTNAFYRVNVGTNTQVHVSVPPGRWYFGVTTECEPTFLTVDVGATNAVTTLRLTPATTPRSRSTLPGHARQRNR